MLNIKTYVEYHHLEIEDKCGRLFCLIRPEVEWIEGGNTDGVSEEYKKTEGSTRFFHT